MEREPQSVLLIALVLAFFRHPGTAAQGMTPSGRLEAGLRVQVGQGGRNP